MIDWKDKFPKGNIYFQTDNGILYCGRAEKILPTLPDEVIDCVVTSPPYNLGIKYGVYKDELPYEEYLSWCKEWGNELYRILKPDGRFALNHYLSCGKSGFRFAPLMDLNWIFQKIGFKHHGLAIWWDTTLSKRTAWGSWLSARAPYLNSPFEGVLIMFKNQWRRFRKGKNAIDKNLFMEIASGIWKIMPEKTRIHPAPFPENLVEYILRFFTYENDLIIDPFIGSGTTAVVCEKLNRKWIGIELDKKYCEIAKKRILNLKRGLF